MKPRHPNEVPLPDSQKWVAVPPKDCNVLGWIVTFGSQPLTHLQTPVLRISAGQRMCVVLPLEAESFCARTMTDDGVWYPLPFEKAPR